VVDEIKNYTPEEISFAFNNDIAFGTAGIRGPIK
jgi:hypothetical protein